MRKWYPLLLLIVAALFAVFAYPRLPERVPVHWNLRGEPDGWSSRETAAFLLPLIGVAFWALLRFLPRIDPRRENYRKFESTYQLMIELLLTFLLFLYLVTLGAGIGWPIHIERLVPFAVGVLLVLIGNVLPRARSNWWFGIRTPWTLSNERVWARTHRVGGYLMIAAGVACIASAFVPGLPALVLVLSAIVLSSLGSFVYSYFAWKQETSS